MPAEQRTALDTGGSGGLTGQCSSYSACGRGGSIKSCVSVSVFGGGTSCWYEVSGRRFDCSGNCNCESAARAAVNYCSP